MTNFYPSITETIPPTYPDLRNEFGKLETLMWNQTKSKAHPTPCLPEANDRLRHISVVIKPFKKTPENTFVTCLFLFRINTLGYNYCPVHTEIYGSYRNQAVRGAF